MITRRMKPQQGADMLTLRTEEVANIPDNEAHVEEGKTYSKTHASGWTIAAKIKVDWYTWVDEFKAFHPVWGAVWGSFQEEVFADCVEGYENFIQSHKPYSWDSKDI